MELLLLARVEVHWHIAQRELRIASLKVALDVFGQKKMITKGVNYCTTLTDGMSMGDRGKEGKTEFLGESKSAGVIGKLVRGERSDRSTASEGRDGMRDGSMGFLVLPAEIGCVVRFAMTEERRRESCNCKQVVRGSACWVGWGKERRARKRGEWVVLKRGNRGCARMQGGRQWMDLALGCGKYLGGRVV